MHEWVAEYTRGNMLFNVQSFRALSKADAEHMAWCGYMQLADCLTITVYRIFMQEQNTTTLSERDRKGHDKRANKPGGFKRVA